MTGKSTLSAPFVMAHLMLYPNFQSYILSLTAMQSQDTFLKMEQIAKKQIESFAGLTDIFLGEVSSNNASSDGFIHHPQGFRLRLYNNSFVQTVSGDEDTSRGELFALLWGNSKVIKLRKKTGKLSGFKPYANQSGRIVLKGYSHAEHTN